MGSLCFWTLPLEPWASVLSRTLLISLMGPWDLSLALLPSQLTALLTKRENMAQLWAARGGSDHYPEDFDKIPGFITPHKLPCSFPFPDRVPTHPSRPHPAVTSSKKPTMIPKLGYTLPLASLSPSHDPGFYVVSSLTGQSSLRTTNSPHSVLEPHSTLSRCSTWGGLGTYLSLGSGGGRFLKSSCSVLCGEL